MSFIKAFSNQILSYSVSMSKVEVIDYKTQSRILVYLFVMIIASKSTIVGNMSIFKELNINQLSFKKDAVRWKKLLTIL